jgi:hypothetical protein
MRADHPPFLGRYGTAHGRARVVHPRAILPATGCPATLGLVVSATVDGAGQPVFPPQYNRIGNPGGGRARGRNGREVPPGLHSPLLRSAPLKPEDERRAFREDNPVCRQVRELPWTKVAVPLAPAKRAELLQRAIPLGKVARATTRDTVCGAVVSALAPWDHVVGRAVPVVQGNATIPTAASRNRARVEAPLPLRAMGRAHASFTPRRAAMRSSGVAVEAVRRKILPAGRTPLVAVSDQGFVAVRMGNHPVSPPQ